VARTIDFAWDGAFFEKRDSARAELVVCARSAEVGAEIDEPEPGIWSHIADNFGAGSSVNLIGEDVLIAAERVGDDAGRQFFAQQFHVSFEPEIQNGNLGSRTSLPKAL